jgi:hypothetical protein
MPGDPAACPRDQAASPDQARQQQPDSDNPDDAFEGRSVQVGTTFGGAAVIRGNLTLKCATASARSWRPWQEGRAGG